MLLLNTPQEHALLATLEGTHTPEQLREVRGIYLSLDARRTERRQLDEMIQRQKGSAQ